MNDKSREIREETGFQLDGLRKTTEALRQDNLDLEPGTTRMQANTSLAVYPLNKSLTKTTQRHELLTYRNHERG
jgi:hypothetical protein